MKTKPVLAASIPLESGQVGAARIDSTQPLRADFNLVIQDPFSLPAYLLSYTVEFDRVDILNPGEGYKVSSYDANDILLGEDCYFNSGAGSIVGCACTDTRANPLLETDSYYAIISSLNGTFDVSNVFSLAFDADNGSGNSISSIGLLGTTPSPVPAHPALLLFGTGLLGLIGIK